MALTHHDLCFGCGQVNLFGLQMELEPQPDGSAEGRFFVKQDHQGPSGAAHPGVLAAALAEAAALIAGAEAQVGGLQVQFAGPVAVGTFVALRARREGEPGGRVTADVTALAPDGTELARARADLVSGVG